MWDREARLIIHSFVIPRGVNVLAGGESSGSDDKNGRVTIEISAAIDDKKWKIIQSPFMSENACTTRFEQKIVLKGGTMSFSETTIVDIYGNSFKHTDQNELTLQPG